MSLILLSLTAFLVSTWTIWLRYFYFKRDPKFQKIKDPRYIKSPAEGTIVYWKVGNAKYLTICKSDELNGERSFRIDEFLDKGKTYVQLGIYMTIYDCHYVVNQINSKIKRIVCLGDNNDCMMMNYLDHLLSIFGISFLKWMDRSEKFIHYNQQYVIEYENGIIIVITMDKYVNKFDYEIDNETDRSYILGFVHRGSQTDIFIPEDLIDKVLIDVGDRVTYKTKLIEVCS